MPHTRQYLKYSQQSFHATKSFRQAVKELALALLGSSIASSAALRAARWDEVKLWHLGYRQALPRNLTFFNNAGCSFSVLSFFALVESYSTQGLAYGGPVVMVWGWVITSIASLCVAACLAELVSTFPTSGGLYYWSYILAPPKTRAIWCWFTGWLNLLGQVAFTSSLEISLARYITSLIDMHFLEVDGDISATLFSPHFQLLIFFAMVVAHILMNCCSQKVTAGLFTFSSIWHILATIAFCLALLFTAPSYQSTKFVFLEWMPNSDVHGVENPVYIVLIGLLMSQWVIMGYDSSVQLCEETVDADRTASWGVVASVFGCSSLGLGLLLTLTYTMPSADSLLNTERAAFTQLSWDVYAARYGNGKLCIPLLYIPLVALFFCAFTSMTSSGRAIFAFSRDGAMVGSSLWKRVSDDTGMPVYGVSMMGLLAFLLGVPAIYVKQVFHAISAVSVVALSLSYGIPILLRLFKGSRPFIPGPFSLGKYSRPVGLVSCLWIAMVSIVFCLPAAYPINPTNLNYAPVVLLSVVTFAWITWVLPGRGGKYWFHGPTPNVDSNTDEPSPVTPSRCSESRTARPTLSRIFEQRSQELEEELDDGYGSFQRSSGRKGLMQTRSVGASTTTASRLPSSNYLAARTASTTISRKHSRSPASFVSHEMLDAIMDFNGGAAHPVRTSTSGSITLPLVPSASKRNASKDSHGAPTGWVFNTYNHEDMGPKSQRLLSSVTERSSSEVFAHDASPWRRPSKYDMSYSADGTPARSGLPDNSASLFQLPGLRRQAAVVTTRPIRSGSQRRSDALPHKPSQEQRSSARRVPLKAKASFLGLANSQPDALEVLEGARLSGQRLSWAPEAVGAPLELRTSPVRPAQHVDRLHLNFLFHTHLDVSSACDVTVKARKPSHPTGSLEATTSHSATLESQARRFSAALSTSAAKRAGMTLRATSFGVTARGSQEGVPPMTTIFSKVKKWLDPRLTNTRASASTRSNSPRASLNLVAPGATPISVTNKASMHFSNAPDLMIPSIWHDAPPLDDEDGDDDQGQAATAEPEIGRLPATAHQQPSTTVSSPPTAPVEDACQVTEPAKNKHQPD